MKRQLTLHEAVADLRDKLLDEEMGAGCSLLRRIILLSTAYGNSMGEGAPAEPDMKMGQIMNTFATVLEQEGWSLSPPMPEEVQAIVEAFLAKEEARPSHPPVREGESL